MSLQEHNVSNASNNIQTTTQHNGDQIGRKGEPAPRPDQYTPRTRPIPELTPKQEERFWSYVEKREPSACWPWHGGCSSSRGVRRYGTFRIGAGIYFAHRVAYTVVRGPIPDGMTIDHVAAVCQLGGLCCNPSHQEPCPLHENRMRYYRNKTHCKRGHPRPPFDGECRQCANLRQRQYYARKAAQPDRRTA